MWLHSFKSATRARCAAGATIAAIVGAAWLALPSTPVARPAVSGPAWTALAAAAVPARSMQLIRPRPCKLAHVRLRCPDIIMSAPALLHIDRGTEPGRVLLRAASALNNRGSGPLEIRARRGGRGRMAVYQGIYDRRGRRHLFRTPATLIYKY